MNINTIKFLIEDKDVGKRLDIILSKKINQLDNDLGNSLKNNNISLDTNKNNEQEFKKLNNLINKYKNENENFIINLKVAEKENNTLTDELKKNASQNLKLNKLQNEIRNKIIELENIIEEQNLIIQLLKDKNPHG